MKKINLTDGMPASIRKQEQSNEVIILTDKVKRICVESKLSYLEVNKALYLADIELYKKTIGLL